MTARTWLPDPSHYPEQMTPLSATVWFEAVGIGLHRAMRELRGPFGGFEARTHLGWAYEGEWEPEWAVDPSGLERAAVALAERWKQELRPRARQITSALHELRPEAPPPAGAAAMFDRFWGLVLEQWTIHFLAVVPAQAAIELFTGAFAEAVGDADPLAPYRILDLRPNESTRADDRLVELARAASELGIDAILREYPPDAALGRFRELHLGRSWLSMLDTYLSTYGGRARWHELSLPREAEDPVMTLEAIRLFLESGAGPSPDRTPEAERAERALVERVPQMAGPLAAAAAGYDIKESHVYDIDYPGLLATREVLLGFGRRLTAEGRLETPEDVWMLRREELGSAVAGALAGLSALPEARRAGLAEGLREGPRPFLGDPPGEVERHALLDKFYGAAARGGPDGRSLRGTRASDGIGEGPARIVRSVDDLRRVRSGDVLVATTTTPAWTPLFPSLAGLVTETGGVLSHAAIVAREYGVPTVVGVAGATVSIPDGVRVRVDGTAGAVTLLGPGAS